MTPPDSPQSGPDPARAEPAAEHLDPLVVFTELVMRGATLQEARAAIKKRFKSWRLTDEDVARLYDEATVSIADSIADQKLEAARSLARLHTLYGKASTVQDFKTALAAQKEINALLQLRRAQPDARMQKLLAEL